MLLQVCKKFYDWFHAKWIDGQVHVTSTIDKCLIDDHVRISKYSYCYNTQIGAYSYLAGYNLVINTNIGKFCSVGLFVSICPGKHPTNTFVSTSPVFYSLAHRASFSTFEAFNESGSVQIGSDVWIGSNAIILDDIKIGHGAIIAAGSVVNKDVEPYSIVGGVPAKLIRKRFSEDVIEQLLESKWWERSDEWLKKHYESMHDLEKFLNLIKTE